MSSYFDEHNCVAHSSDDHSSNLYISLARMLQDMGFESEVMSVLSSRSERRPPASKEFIKNMEKCNDFNDSEKYCVCLKQFVVNQTVRLECSHKFHVQCITPWLQMHNSCPLCRTEFPTDDEEYERNKRETIRKQTAIKELHDSMFT